MKKTLIQKAGYVKGTNPVNLQAVTNLLSLKENSAYVQSESHYSDGTTQFTIVINMVKKPTV